MRIMVTGAAGMIGAKLTRRLLTDGALGGEPISRLDLVDIVEVHCSSELVRSHVVDLAAPAALEQLVDDGPDVVFHLAGVVSGEAEADFDKGNRTNLDGTRALFDAIRHSPVTPRVVFASSIAVFGAPFPDVIDDNFHLTPLTSYGTQKMVGEALLADYSRREFLDGVGIRLPTVTVRPGAPNAAASGFFSNIIREPLSGKEGVLPVSRDVRHPHASPRSAVDFSIRAAEIDSALLGPRRNLTMPSVSVTVAQQIEALGRLGGSGAVDLIREVPDPKVAAIVRGWPREFSAERARDLGFECESSFDEIIQAHMEDEQNL